MKTKNQKSLFVTGFAALAMLVSCNKEEVGTETTPEQKIDLNSSVTRSDCGFVDNNWPSSATLSTTLQAAVGTSSDVTLMTNQNTAIKTFWRGTGVAAPTFRFVRNGTNYNSTYNAISYGDGKIYYGEGIFKDAKAKDASNLINVMVLAHEYGHQLQYAFGLPSVSESTARPNELEADGMAGYYLRRGYGKSTFAAIATAYDFAFAIGDFGTTNPGHHGTPAQRKSAVRLGFLLADPANAKLTATSFDSNFFFYYTGVKNGTYRLAKPATMTQKGHDLIMSEMSDLVRLQNGTMSDQEYKNLD